MQNNFYEGAVSSAVAIIVEGTPGLFGIMECSIFSSAIQSTTRHCMSYGQTYFQDGFRFSLS